MRIEKLLSGLLAAGLAVLLVFGGIGCLVTGFDLAAALDTVLLACAAAAVAGAVFGSLRVGMLPIGMVTLAGLWLWKQEVLEPAVETLAYQISRQYNTGYGWGVLYWNETLPAGDITPALCIWGALAAALLGWFLVKGRTPLLPCILALAPAVACLVLKDTVPQAGWLYAVLLGLCLLLLTHGTRKKDPVQGSRLTVLLIVPAAAALVLLFLLIPQEGYDRQAGAQVLEDWIMQWFEDPGDEPTQEVFAPAGISEEDVNLKTVGPRPYQISVAMEVTAQETGVMYLRGQVYDRYTGISWSATEHVDRAENYLVSNEVMKLSVRTKYQEDILYLPYVSPYALREGKVDNNERLKEYTVTYTPLVSDINSWGNGNQTLPEQMTPFLWLPEVTRQEAAQWLPEMTDFSPAGQWRYVQQVAQLVSSIADYNLYTRAMPAGETDFVMWFLEESETGYCVHFASTAAVLLRAAGIPTRYVTGYVLSAEAGETVRVYHKDAHAWAECYIDGVGWQIVEATPADGTSPVPPENTEPAERPLPTEPSVESQETKQPEGTMASRPATPNTEPADRPEKPEAPMKREMAKWLQTALWILVLVLAIPGQWKLRLWLRKRRFARGTTNQQALCRFREILRHCRLRRRPPEREIILLAQKAKFSRHTITEEELARLDAWLQDSQKEFREGKLWLRLGCTLLLALY